MAPEDAEEDSDPSHGEVKFELALNITVLENGRDVAQTLWPWYLPAELGS